MNGVCRNARWRLGMVRSRALPIIAGLSIASIVLLAVATVAVTPIPSTGDAASHRDSPLVAADPQIDGTDFFAFISPEGNGTVTFIADYYPQIANEPQTSAQ